MRHTEPTDEVRDLAALYALRALPADETVGFEAHLAEGCRTCEEELRVFSTVSGLLGLGAPALAAPPELRDKLLARLAIQDAAWVIVRSDEGEWQDRGSGMRLKYLYRDTVEGRFTALGRLEAGARYPSHWHAAPEELYVLDGDLRLHGRVLRARDYCAAVAGAVHADSGTEGGCTFLVVASERDQAAEPDATGERGLVFVTAREGAWHEGTAPGVTTRRIFSDLQAGTITAEGQMQPGARLPGHRHMTAEQFYMLEGDAHVAGQVLRAGDYYRAPRASAHEVSYTEGGCTFLLIASRVELLGLSS